MLRLKTLRLTIVLTLSALSAEAHAYTRDKCNGKDFQIRQPMNFRVDTNSVASGSPSLEQVDLGALDWNNVLNASADIQLDFQAVPSQQVGLKNKVNDVWFSDLSDLAPASGSVVGVTRTRIKCDQFRGEYLEVDIELDNQLNDTVSNCRSVGYSVRVTALHEMGHALGFGHEDTQLSHMRSSSGDVTYCGDRPTTPHPDETRGLRDFYPCWVYGGWCTSDVVDLGALAFWVDPAGTLLRNEEDGIILDVCPGDDVPTRWTASNRGDSGSGHFLNWYLYDEPDLSADSIYISSAQTWHHLIGGERLESKVQHVRVPNNAVHGRVYYVGFALTAFEFDMPFIDPDVSDNVNWNHTRWAIKSAAECP